jgi:two-component system LytT family response regulator
MPDAAARIRTVFVDDEELARSTVRQLLAKDREIEVVAECANGLEALERVRELAPDLLILDVQMPGLSGFEVLERLEGSRTPVVVFTTAYDTFAVEAFDKSAADYLLKPFDDERFRRAVLRAKERIRASAVADTARRIADVLAGLGRAGAAEAPARRIAIPHGARTDYVDASEIEWIEAADQYVQIHARGATHLLRESMERVEKMLDPSAFLRVHRSAIVPIARIRSLEVLDGGNAQVLLASGVRLPVSRSRVADVRARLA